MNELFLKFYIYFINFFSAGRFYTYWSCSRRKIIKSIDQFTSYWWDCSLWSFSSFHRHCWNSWCHQTSSSHAIFLHDGFVFHFCHPVFGGLCLFSSWRKGRNSNPWKSKWLLLFSEGSTDSRKSDYHYWNFCSSFRLGTQQIKMQDLMQKKPSNVAVSRI